MQANFWQMSKVFDADKSFCGKMLRQRPYMEAFFLIWKCFKLFFTQVTSVLERESLIFSEMQYHRYSIIGFEKSCNAWLEQPYPTLTDSVFQFFPQYIQYWVQAMIICAHQDVDTRSKFKWVERIGVYFRSPLVYLGVYPPTTVNLKSLCTNLIIFYTLLNVHVWNPPKKFWSTSFWQPVPATL